jgi:CRP-like cAMP-binding protein
LREDALDLTKLGSLTLFQQLNPSELSRVSEAADRRNLDEGAYFFFQDDPAERVYALTHGKVRLGQVTVDGQQIILSMISAWHLFGVIAMVKDASYPVFAQAATPCRALSWKRDTLDRLAADCPQLAFNAMQIMAGHVREFQERIRELSTERVERRIARVLLRLASQVGRKVEDGVLIDLAISRQDIAEMSATTLYTVSRTLSRWEKQGLIDTGRERVLIHSPHGLVSIAEDLLPDSSQENN